MNEISEAQRKEQVRRKYAYALWKLKTYLRENIARHKAFLKQQKLGDNEHNLTAVQAMTQQATLDFIIKMEQEYENGKPDI